MNSNYTKIDIQSLWEKLAKEVIGTDFMLLEDIKDVPFFDYPTKIDMTVVSVCITGELEGSINLKNYKFQANDFIITLPGQILQYLNVSHDFSGLHIVMSQHFVERLEINLRDELSAFVYLKENQMLRLRDEEIEKLSDYFNLLRKAIRKTENPYRIDVVLSLLLAMFYEMNNLQELLQEEKTKKTKKTKKRKLFDDFYNLLIANHKESREVVFYAKKLCLTPKYLSSSVKETTGKSAFEWINDYVILEAKSMLKVSEKTIQEISVDLNFPNQSFFGKYFKQHVGITPSQYRKQ